MKDLINKLRSLLPPLPAKPPTHAPNQTSLIQLAFLIAIALVLHFSIASPLIAIFSCVVFALKCLILWQQRKSPPQWLIILLTISSVGLIVFSYGGWNGQTAGISFLVLLVALKFLESQTVRDYFVVCLILYFLAASSFLFNSTIPNIIMVVAYTAAITALLFKITNPAPISSKSALKEASALILKSIPLALFLFFFFPRVQGSFGFIPSLDKGQNSLDNALVAGEMASSAFSNELAFKAEFSGEIPPNPLLYWRAKVMDEEVDFTWRVNLDKLSNPQIQKITSQMRQQVQTKNTETVDYQILHEPTTDVFLPYLDYVSKFSKGKIIHDYSVLLQRQENGSFSYSGGSTNTPPFVTDPIPTNYLLETKSRPSAKTQAFLTSITQNAESDLDRVTTILNYFAGNGFAYSLTPPGLNEFTPLDDFLFNTRTGYCEHYASAFTTLVRFMRIPARVVVGYQGGTVNQAGNFVEVRYSDAHAWSEVWIDGQWIRVDPTAVISPERIEYGMDAIRELWDSDLLGSNASGTALSNFLNPSGTALAWKRITDTWSNVQYQWKKWIVDYDSNTQQELLKKLGIATKNGAYTLVVILSIGVMFILAIYFWQLIPKAKKRTGVQKVYGLLIEKARKAGIQHDAADTPSELAAKLIRRFPESEQSIRTIMNNFLKIVYGNPSTEGASDDIKTLNKSVKELKFKTR